MPHSSPRTQVMRPSPLCYPSELGRGEAFPGTTDSMSPVPRGSSDPGPHEYFNREDSHESQSGPCSVPPSAVTARTRVP